MVCNHWAAIFIIVVIIMHLWCAYYGMNVHDVPKSGIQTRGSNFVKSQPIFTILLPLERVINFQWNDVISHQHLQYGALLRYLWKFKSSNLFQIKTRIIIICQKMKISFILLNGYCCYHNSCSKCPPFARTHAWRCPCHSSIALSMTLWSISCQMYSKCCYHFFL